MTRSVLVDSLSQFRNDIRIPVSKYSFHNVSVGNSMVRWDDINYLYLVFTCFRVIFICLSLSCNTVVLIIIIHCQTRGTFRAYYFLKLLSIQNLMFLIISFIVPLCLKYVDYSFWCDINIFFMKFYAVAMPSLTYLRNGMKVCIAWDRYVCLRKPSSLLSIRKHKMYVLGPYLYAIVCFMINVPNQSMYSQAHFHLDPEVNLKNHKDVRVKCRPEIFELSRILRHSFIIRELLVFIVAICIVTILMARMLACVARIRLLRSHQVGPGNSSRWTGVNEGRCKEITKSQLGNKKKTVHSFFIQSTHLFLQPVKNSISSFDRSNLSSVQNQKWSRIVIKIYRLFFVIMCTLFVMSLRTLYNATYLIRCTISLCRYYITPLERVISIFQVLDPLSIIGFVVIDDNLIKSFRTLRRQLFNYIHPRI